MLKTATLIGALALAFSASSALAADDPGPFHIVAGGRCHGAKGFVLQSKCATPGAAHTYKLDSKGQCHDESGKFAKGDFCKK